MNKWMDDDLWEEKRSANFVQDLKINKSAIALICRRHERRIRSNIYGRRPEDKQVGWPAGGPQ